MVHLRSVILAALWFVLAASGQESSVRTSYHVKQVASGAVYLDGGSNDGLAEGMKLKVSHLAAGDALVNRREVAFIAVTAVAGNSAVCEVKESKAPIQAGDTAELSEADVQVIQIVRSSQSKRQYAQVVSFTEGDPIEEEAREYVPKPPLPEVNRLRGRIGFDQDVIVDHSGSGSSTYQEGLVLRADFTRIGGTYWNFVGYWRGRLSSQSSSFSQQTLQDLLNRTYQIGLYYNNPNSRYVAGVGRFLLPWAASLDTIDGGYIGRRMSKSVTVGMFAGSTPDPTAWNFDPNREMIGVFTSYQHGSFSGMRVTSTVGLAESRLHWHPERRFLFLENSLMVNNRISIYQDLQLDQLAKALVTDAKNGPRLARSLITVRLQASKALTFNLSHNYFRGIPTFDTRLIGTGLLDKLLFQGFSGGFRLELPRSSAIYADLGASKREQDSKQALNYMYGLTLGRLPHFPFRADMRYSRFNSSFGSGAYESISLSRQIAEKLRIEVQGGQQNLHSLFTTQNRSRYITTSLDYLIDNHYILGFNWTAYRGAVQNYDQTFLNLGYRF
jgi:hypothetical protein